MEARNEIRNNGGIVGLCRDCVIFALLQSSWVDDGRSIFCSRTLEPSFASLVCPSGHALDGAPRSAFH